MKKILFIIWSYSYGGGAESLLTNIVNRLDTKKYEVGIMEFYNAGIKKEPINSNIDYLGYITYKDDPEYTKKLYYVHMKPDVIIKKYIPCDYDLYVSFNYQIPTFLLPSGKKSISWIHTNIYDLLKNENCRKLQFNAFEKANRIVSICDLTTKSIIELFPSYEKKIVEIQNNIDINVVQNKGKEKSNIVLKNPSIVYVGRLDNRKNPLYMVEVFNQILKKRNDIHLYFLGEGYLRQAVIEKAGEYGINRNVHILGYIDNPFPLIKQSDVLCLFSKAEGFATVFLEAAALGVPFVASPIGGAEYMSNNHTCGKIVENNDDAIREILNFVDGNKEEIKQMCAESAKRLDINKYISKIESLFDEVVAEPEKEMVIADNDNDFAELPYYYQFPTDLIKKGSNIILYGAGMVGIDFYSYICSTGYCNIISWVDSNKSGLNVKGYKISEINEIPSLKYDYILISVLDETVSNNIKKILINIGVNETKIKWKSVFFRED